MISVIISTLFLLITFIIQIINTRSEKKIDDENIIDSIIDYNYNCNNSKYGPIEQWNTSQVTNMDTIFIYADLFNSDINKWDVSNVISMYGTFYYTSSFNSNISGWNVSNVENMGFMFRGSSIFNSNISGWDVSRVKNMYGMFYEAKYFNGDLRSWNVTNVTQMIYMFYSATSFNGNILLWDVSNVIKMNKIFNGATSFHKKLCWNVLNSARSDDMFTNSPGSLLLYPACIAHNENYTLTLFSYFRVTLVSFTVLIISIYIRCNIIKYQSYTRIKF